MRFFRNESKTSIVCTTDPNFVVSDGLIEIDEEEYNALLKEQEKRQLMEQLAMLEEMSASTLDLGTEEQAQSWPGWDSASWTDVKEVMDEYGMGRIELPKDIQPGCYKFWPIIKNGKETNLLFKLNSIVDGVLIFESTSPQVSDFLSLDEHLETLYNMSKYNNCLTNDKMFILTKDKFNLDIEHISWTSTPVVCATPGGEFIEAEQETEFYYVPMFAIGLHELGVEYNGRTEYKETDLYPV